MKSAACALLLCLPLLAGAAVPAAEAASPSPAREAAQATRPTPDSAPVRVAQALLPAGDVVLLGMASADRPSRSIVARSAQAGAPAGGATLNGASDAPAASPGSVAGEPSQREALALLVAGLIAAGYIASRRSQR